MEEVPIIQLGHLSEAQVRALRLADNKIALNSGWDVDLLRVEFAEIPAMDVKIDLGITGFSSGEIEVLLAGSPDPDDDTIPAVRVAPRTKPGDIYELGEHRVGCGDGRDVSFLRRVIGTDREIDCAFLDGPYDLLPGNHAIGKLARQMETSDAAKPIYRGSDHRRAA